MKRNKLTKETVQRLINEGRAQQFINTKDFEIKKMLIAKGEFIDKFLHDEDYRVRIELVENDWHLDTLINDTDERVKQAAYKMKTMPLI